MPEKPDNTEIFISSYQEVTVVYFACLYTRQL